MDAVDPFIALAAAACSTRRIRLGTMVTPLPRRRPLVVARQSVTLDRLSGGRLVLGVGSGAGPFEWDYVGDEPDPVVRGEMLDEHLELLARLWTGEPVSHEGAHYRVAGPDWSGRLLPPAAATAAHPGLGRRHLAGAETLRPGRAVGRGGADADGRDLVGRRHRCRRHGDGALRGRTDRPSTSPPPARATPPTPLAARVFADHEDAGATWWVEAVHPWRYGYDEGARGRSPPCTSASGAGP